MQVIIKECRYKTLDLLACLRYILNPPHTVVDTAVQVTIQGRSFTKSLPSPPVLGEEVSGARTESTTIPVWLKNKGIIIQVSWKI